MDELKRIERSDTEQARWLADKIPAYGDYAAEAGQLLIKLADALDARQSAGQERGEAVAWMTEDDKRVAELEARAESFRLEGLRIIDDLSDCQIERNQAKDRIAALESQLTESREREAKLIADLDANLEAFSDERKRALSAENLARELHELLADYVSQDSIAQGYGAGIGGTTYEKAEAFLDALAAEKE